MFHDRLQVYTLSIVFIGDFNPVIIQPFWLASKKLIREAEAEKAKVEIVHTDIVRFELDWVFFEVRKDRFEFRTTQEPFFEPMRDLIVSIFNFLKETPITAVGINHVKSFALRDQAQYLQFGNKLTPLENWSDFLKDPRLMNLEVVETKRADNKNGHYRIEIQPADPKLKLQYGVSININDHYIISDGSKGRDGEMVKIVKDNWELSQKKAFDVIENIWKKVNV